MKVTEERLVVVQATRDEWFGIFISLSASMQAKYGRRFRSIICDEQPPSDTAFRMAEWKEIAGESLAIEVQS